MTTQERNKIVEENIPLVRKIACKYSKNGILDDDMFQIGCLGLIKAVEKFDITKGFEFSTYAYRMIAGEICNKIFKQRKVTAICVSMYDNEFGLDPIVDNIIDESIREYKFIEADSFERLLIKPVKLTELQKQVIKMKFNHGLTCEEIGNIIDCSKQNVSLLERRALAKLKRYWTYDKLKLQQVDNLERRYING